MRHRRNSPLTPTQVSALKSILDSHGIPLANPKRRRIHKKRRISAALRRKLIANLKKARAAKARKHHRRGRR